MLLKQAIILINLLLALFTSALAQTVPPKGPAAEKAIKAFSEGNTTALSAALPDLVKAHPTHPFTIFFKAYLADNLDNNVNDALRGYSEVIKVAPDLMEAHFFRARIFNEKGMYEKAIEDMTNAIKYDDTKSSNLYTLRGEMYSNANKYNEAFLDFKQAIQMSPELANNYRGIMNVGLKANKKDEAITIIKNAIEGRQAQNPGVWEVWGDINLRNKQFAVADKAYDKSRSLPEAAPTADSYNSAAIAALNVNDMAKAKQLAEKAVTANPKGHLFYCTRAEISTHDKTWEEVYTWAQKALAINPKSARANMLMAIGVKFTNRGEALSAEYEKKSKQLQAEGIVD